MTTKSFVSWNEGSRPSWTAQWSICHCPCCWGPSLTLKGPQLITSCATEGVGGRLCLCLYVCECVVYMWAWQHGQWHQMWVFSRELNLSSSYLHKHSVMSVGEGEMWNPYICCCSSPSSGIAVSRLIKGVGHCVCGWLGRPKKLHAF